MNAERMGVIAYRIEKTLGKAKIVRTEKAKTS